MLRTYPPLDHTRQPRDDRLQFNKLAFQNYRRDGALTRIARPDRLDDPEPHTAVADRYLRRGHHRVGNARELCRPGQ